MLLLLPTTAVEAGGRAAWMVAVLTGVSGWFTLLMVGKLSQRFPDLSFTGYASRLFGPALGKILAVGLFINFGLNASVDLGVATNNLEGIYFVKTPPWVVTLALAVIALSLTWFGLVTAARMAPLFTLVLGATFLVTIPLLWRWMKPGYLIPLFDPSPINLFDKPFWVSVGIIRAALYPVGFMPYIQDPKKAVRTMAWAHWVGWVGLFIAVLAPVLVFGPDGAKAIAQPFPFVVGIIRVTNFPLERFEMLARLAFHINTIYAIATIYFTAGRLLADVFNTRRIRLFMVAAAALSLLPIILLPSVRVRTEFGYTIVILGMVMTWTVFPLLWLVYWIRGVGQGSQQAKGAAT